MSTYREIPVIKASLAPKEKDNLFEIEELFKAKRSEWSDYDVIGFYDPVYYLNNFEVRLGILNKISSPYDGVLPFPVKRVLSCRHDILEDHRHKHPDGRPFDPENGDKCQNHTDKCEGCTICDEQLVAIREHLEMELD